MRLSSVNKRYRLGHPWVLRDVNMTIDRGAVVEVRGANGAGKSTLLRMLAGAVVPTRGRRVAADGLQVGYGPERLSPAPPFTADGYLARHACLRHLSHAGGDHQAASLADRLGLTSGLLREPLGALSKGSLQKVVLIQALLGRPELVVLDEPFAGLDHDAAVAASELVRQTAADGSTVVFSDHREHAAWPRADATWSVSDGTVHPEARNTAAPGLSHLSDAIEIEESDGRLRLLIADEHGDRALAKLVAHGWHILAVAPDPAATGQTRIEAILDRGRR